MEFYGLFGESLSHSLSPTIHRRIYSAWGIKAAYKCFEIPSLELKSAVDALRTLSIAGVNVTIPYKEQIISYLDELSQLSKELQAVNTIKNDHGKLIGYNTDYAGFDLIFKRRNWSVKNRRVTVLGTGGAAKTVIAYLRDQQAEEIAVISRSPERFEDTKMITYIDYDALDTLSGDILINTTPVGMYPYIDETPAKESVIRSFDTLIDLIYNPNKTRFLSLGEKNGKETANGLDMLVGQAVRSVEIWQDISIESSLVDELISELQRNGIDI